METVTERLFFKFSIVKRFTEVGGVQWYFSEQEREYEQDLWNYVHIVQEQR